ncbi:MAG: glycosyltransferase 87 family protein [Oscillospiraceae bacterium]|nr:glycosyltransferase 87 family protein [Oscillospiraceae bacterium]
MKFVAALFLFAEAVLAFLLLSRRVRLKSAASFSVVFTLLLASFVPRLLFFDYETLDYQWFLGPWVDFYRNNGGFAALNQNLGNYNVPYLTLLAFFSYLPVRDLYLIKLLSVLFDVLLAWGGLRLVSRMTEDPVRRIGVFFALLLLPTVFLNGAFWGQCDSIYAALAVLALADALDDRPWRSMILLALSFGFKLQAVFLIPVFAALLFTGKLRWKHLPVFPLSYVVSILPAVIAGRPFFETLTLYLGQTGSIGDGLNYNSPSVFALIRDPADPALAGRIGILAAFLFMLLVLGVCFVFRRRLSDRRILAAALLLAIGIPFLLPHMHDRYFFGADALSVILAFAAPELFPVAALVQFASILGYHAYLAQRWLLTMDHGARALILALITTGAYWLVSLRRCEDGEKKLDKTQ